MAWFVYSGGRRTSLVSGVALRIGRDESCDIVVSSNRISRHHATLSMIEDGQWLWRDESANGSFLNGERILDFSGTQQASIHLGSVDGPAVLISDDPTLDVNAIQSRLADSGDSPSEDFLDSKGFQLVDVTRIGRALDNNIVLDGPLVSAHHAHVVKLPHGFDVIDLASSRGTYVNGKRITRQKLNDGDVVSFGGNSVKFHRDGTVVPVRDDSGLAIEVEHLSFTVDGNHILNDLSFTVPPRKVLAIVGPSGSGKSTTLTMLSGIRGPSGGSVTIGGRDLQQEYENLRFSIGMVPQQDLVPAQLNVREAIDFAARLRFSRDVSVLDRSERVNQVIADLGLSERSDLRIDRLSGGQRKRVSVALEMLTKPPVLYLDEPTSGLDPGLDQQVMTLLRELADSGRTVVVVTHAVENLYLADLLMVLAPGGHIAYFGPPGDAPGYFNASDMPSVFLALETAPGHEWARRWRIHEQGSGPTDAGKLAQNSQISGAESYRTRIRFTDAMSQFITLVARNARVVFADKPYVALLAALPLVLALTGILVGSAAGLGLIAGEPVNPGARFILTIFVLGAVFTGASTSIQELVKDRVIYQRERAVGLSRSAYILSKVVVLGAIASVQGFIFASLSLVGRPGPAEPVILPWSLTVIVTVTIATLVSCMLGLLLSTLIPTRDAALPTLVIVTMVQVVLSGALPLRFEGLLNLVGPFVPGYWAFEAMASAINLSVLIGDPLSGNWAPTAGNVLLGWGLLLTMGMAFIIATLVLSGRHDPGRK